jgi:hypothetical protein
MVGRLPEAWIPPGHLLDLRARVRLRHTLVDQRGEWQQRIQAVLYHHGVAQRRDLLTVEKRQWLEELIDLPAAAREQVTVALAVIDALDAQSEPLTRELRAYGRRQPGCRALMAHYGIGALTAVTILAELGDARRFSSSRHAVRYAGLDITVHQSDQRRAPGHLSRHGPPALRWALYEAAQLARRPSSPDHAYDEQAAARLGGNRACLAVARKLLKRSYHTLRELGDEALQASGLNQLTCARSPPSHRCAAAGSPHAAAATLTPWPAQKDRAAATLPPAGSPHQPSRHRPAARPDRGPR